MKDQQQVIKDAQKKANKWVLIILGIFLISVLVCVSILSFTDGNKTKDKNITSSKNSNNTQNTQNTLNTVTKDTTNTEGSDIGEGNNGDKIYTKFPNANIDKVKNVFDGYWNEMQNRDKDNTKNIEYNDWKSIKRTTYPYYQIAYKEFYIKYSSSLAVVAITYDDDENVVAMQVRVTDMNIIEEKYGEEYYTSDLYIIYSIPNILLYLTDNEELKEDFKQELIKCVDSGQWQLNKSMNGIKFTIGVAQNNELAIDVVLEEYAAQ